MSIKKEAEKEKTRMQEVFSSLKIKNKNAKEIYESALNYYQDALYFFKKKKYLQAFEAFVISWAYIDAGMKLKLFFVQKEQKKWFT